ncbi:MAG: DUF6391 domain-containing protein [Dehalococcoidia bacterium]
MLNKLIDRIRRNHGLEHATITLMLARQGPTRVLGRSDHGGFYVYARVETDRLREYAEEALARMQRGEANLAISPMCGTNIVVAGVLAGVGSSIALGRSERGEGIPRAIMASLLAVVASQPIGRLVQKYATTSPDMGGVSIVSVERVGGGAHRVRTAFA